MVYCYECGEQIAENDIFCPFCGITLKPITVEEDEGDNASFDKTIAVQQPKIESAAEVPAVKAADAINVPPAKTEAPQMKERLVAAISERKNDDFADQVTADNLNLQNDSFEMSPEQIEREIDLAEVNEKVAVEEELKQMEELFEEQSPQSNVSESNRSESYISEPEIAELTKSVEEPEIEPALISNEASFSDTEENSDQTTDEESGEKPSFDNENTKAKDEIASPEPSTSPDKIELGVFHIKEETPENAEVKSSEVENPVVEPPIVMPNDELPAAENCPPSRFDSVSIMERKDAAEITPKKIETGDSKPENSAAENSPNAAELVAVAAEPRSHTTPNIGGSDTDNRNKTKLKPLEEGTVLNNRYEIIRKIGGGGMGAVYLASDKNLGGVLRAVKEMVQSYIEDEQQEKAVSDFKRESLLLTSLDHQSIPTIYDYFFDEKEARFYLVMKYISGGDLAGRLRSAPESRIEELSVTQWAIQIADVLDYLHNRQPPIVYRDLKPANIMVDGNSGRVMLIDFGIARWVNKEEKGVTAVGTMGYAPPELFSGNVESRSDIYSLGSTMFHLLTGADPQSNPLLIFDFQKHPRPRQINPQLSDQMERILMRSVEYNADKRFASAAEMRKALDDHLENLKTNRVTFGVKEAPVSVALSDQPVFCGFCGQKIVATDMFCAFCGAKQPLAQQGVHSHSEGYAPAPLTAQLLIIGTNELEQPAFRLEKDENLVGRRDPMSNIFPEVDLSKFDPQTKISRRHARIWRDGSEFMVEDLGSSNGTYILPVVSDTMRLQPHQPQLLANGDKIRLGDTTLHFILG